MWYYHTHLAYVDSGSIIAKVESPILGLAYGLGRTHLGSIRTARKLDRIIHCSVNFLDLARLDSRILLTLEGG